MLDPSAAPTNAGHQSTPPYTGFPAPPPLEPWRPPAPRDDTNGFAIAALVTSLVGLLCGGSVLGLIFGLIALSQIRRTGQRGRGMAITGVVVGVLNVVAVLAVIVWGITTELRGDGLRDESGEVTSAGAVPVEELTRGDCVNGLNDDGEYIGELPAVPCTEPHEGEVFAILELPDGEWPGEEAILDQAARACTDRLAFYSADVYEDESIYVLPLSPTARGWWLDDRAVICIAYFLDGARTGSLGG